MKFFFNRFPLIDIYCFSEDTFLELKFLLFLLHYEGYSSCCLKRAR